MPNNYIPHLEISYYRKFKDRIERNSIASTGGWIVGGGGGGGGQRVCCPPPPLKLFVEPGPPIFLRLCYVQIINDDSWEMTLTMKALLNTG